MKELSEFYSNQKARDGLTNQCRACVAGLARDWYSRHRERAIERRKTWGSENPQRVREIKARWLDRNREKAAATRKRWEKANAEDLNSKRRARRAANPEREQEKRKRRHAKPEQNAANRMRSRIRHAFTQRGLTSDKSRRKWQDLVGYTVADLRAHLERQFTGTMSWENFGKWHVDHIIPVSAFSFSSVDDPDFRACWALSNLRPMWARRNREKAASVRTLL
jgi:hypothetical protein